MSRLIGLTIFLSAIAVAPSSHAVETINASELDYPKLMGKWIVREVTRNGVPIQAQIGQEPGDVITFAPPPGVHVAGVRPVVT